MTPDHPDRSATSGRVDGMPDDPGSKGPLRNLVWHGVGVIAAILIGIAFFFTVIGLFGFAASIAALALFVALAILMFRRPQIGETTQ